MKYFDRRGFLKMVSAGAVLPLVSRIDYLGAEGRKPNIIFILTDDLRYDAMGFIGRYPFLKTPNIDRIRSEGAYFQNAFSTHSLCSPSRVSFLTGMYTHSHGVISNLGAPDFNPDRTPSFAQILQKKWL